jgi:hypothetical protein
VDRSFGDAQLVVGQRGLLDQMIGVEFEMQHENVVALLDQHYLAL